MEEHVYFLTKHISVFPFLRMVFLLKNPPMFFVVYNPYHPTVWYISLHFANLYGFYMVHLGEYTIPPMDWYG